MSKPTKVHEFVVRIRFKEAVNRKIASKFMKAIIAKLGNLGDGFTISLCVKKTLEGKNVN